MDAIFLKSGRAAASNSKHDLINSATVGFTKSGTVGTNLPDTTIFNSQKEWKFLDYCFLSFFLKKKKPKAAAVAEFSSG